MPPIQDLAAEVEALAQALERACGASDQPPGLTLTTEDSRCVQLLERQSGYREVESALWQVEDALRAMIDGEITEHKTAGRGIDTARPGRTELIRKHWERDRLTGLLTRRALTEALQARLSEARRAEQCLSVCLMTLDGFSAEDNHRQAVGDEVLSRFATVLNTRFRSEDLRGRWGREEFVVAFVGEWAQTARSIVRRTIRCFRRQQFVGADGRSFQVRVHPGIATYPLDGATLDELFLVIDQRLCSVKLAGRN